MSDWLEATIGSTQPPAPLPPFSFARPDVDFESGPITDGDERATRSPATPTILIVDDDACAADTFARYFRLEGIDASVVTSGRAVVAMARERAFDAVVLDLRLQDVSGIAVLADLRAGGLWAPVVMISGLGTAEEIAAAMKLGAADFLSKPVNCDDLVRMVRGLIESRRSGDESPPQLAAGAGPRDALADLRAALDRMMWEEAPEANVQRGRPEDSRAPLLAVLAGAAARADLSLGQFLGCARAVREVLSRPGGAKRSELALVALNAIGRPQEPDSHASHPKVKEAIATLGAADSSGLALSEWRLGRRVGLSRSRLGRLLSDETTLGFTEWRRAFRMRRAAQELAGTTEHVRQIAFRVGYSDHGQFDREFEEFFRLTPTGFRRALASD